MGYHWEGTLPDLLECALQKRLPLLEEAHEQGLRLFNGFTEGFPFLSVDLFGQTLVVFIHKTIGHEAEDLAQVARDFYLVALPILKCVIVKQRSSLDARLKNGEIVYGRTPDGQITENGVVYALDLLLNQDASFYLDTRNLREWLRQHSNGMDVLNTFAYTGSLGVAVLAGGANRVVQIDRNAKFLELAQRSAALNHLDLGKMHSTAVDFFVGVGQLKSKRESFDIVVLDPPFFSITEKGRVDQVTETARLINKVRPLVRDGGWLVSVNNALFLPGADYLNSLDGLCSSGYLSIEQLIPVPQDAAGFAEGTGTGWPVDPAPFNHPTKIVVLRVKKKTN